MKVKTLLLTTLLLFGGKNQAEESQADTSAEYRRDTRIKAVSASSTLADRQNRYRPTALIDRNPTTSCVEGKEDDGLGESVTFSFTGKTEIAMVYLTNGFHELGYYEINNRVREILFTTDEGGKFQATLEDTYKLQTIKFPTPLRGSQLQLTIVSVYKGSRDRDTALTEVSIYSTSSASYTGLLRVEPGQSLATTMFPKGLPESFDKASRISNQYYYQHLIFVSDVIDDEVHFIFFTPESSCSFYVFRNYPGRGIMHTEKHNSCAQQGDTLIIGYNVFKARERKLIHDIDQSPRGRLYVAKENESGPVTAYTRAAWKWEEFPTDTMKDIEIGLLKTTVAR